MINDIPIAALAGGAVSQSIALHMTRRLAQQAIMQARAETSHSTLEQRSLMKELVNERIRSIALAADRTIANAQQQRLLTKLANVQKVINSCMTALG